MRSLGLATAVLSLSATAALADITDARNFYEYSDNVLTAGQPTADQLSTAVEDGIEVVISVVPENESIYNPKQKDILQAQGIEYIHVPVNWRSPDDAEFDRFLEAMNSVGDRKVLVHCWANARASALVYAHRAIEAPETQTAELENLNWVWAEVAGYNLDTNTTWQDYLDRNIGRHQEQ
ncbi:protein tyrosine phosphatase family protein [Tateyamaria sp. SN3-11]|uniref:protein tyrosine phosphatase family protein n=1 Tax=Tateyamaria sp. SN3-11 TaxID=3092147 RepID=UPI0039ECF3E9